MSRAVYLLDGGVREARALRSLAPRPLRTRDEVLAAIGGSPRDTLWVVPGDAGLCWLVSALCRTPRRRKGWLLALAPVPQAVVPVLASRFERLVLSPQAMLPLGDIAAVLARADRSDFCIAGSADSRSGSLILVRGDLSILPVPFPDAPEGTGAPAPVAGLLRIVDHGRTVQLGNYEAAFDAFLYERDPEYRRRLLAQRSAEDRSFGACLRRLRKQRRIRLREFGSLEKTVARIERGEVSTPRKATLQSIASILAVLPEEISKY